MSYARKTATTLAVGAFALAGVVGTPVARADDEAFLMTIENRGIHISDPVMQAHAVCLVFQNHPEDSFPSVVEALATYKNNDMTVMDAAYFSGAAIAAYCPQFKSRMEDGG